jgi:hypothetical protein
MLCYILIIHAESQTLNSLFMALLAPVGVACVLLAVSIVFYRRAGGDREAEWSVLAAGLAATLVVANHWNNIIGPLVSGPFGDLASPRMIAGMAANIVSLFGICILGGALIIRWMDRGPTTGRPKGIGHEVAAVAILTVLTQGFLEGAHQIAWRIKATPLPDLDAVSALSTMCRGGVLLGLLAAWLVIAHVAWRGADRLSRWHLISLFSVWVCMDSWMRDLHWVLPQINPYEWTWALAIGVEAGLIAILYGRLVVQRLWARASPLSST